MIDTILQKVYEDIEEAKLRMWAADSIGDNGLRITIWQEVCKLLDKKWELEKDMRDAAGAYTL